MTTFKVGDKVQLDPKSYWTAKQSIERAKKGTVGTVVSVVGSGRLEVTFDDGGKNNSAYSIHFIPAENISALDKMIAQTEGRIEQAFKAQEKARDREAKARLEAADAKIDNDIQNDRIKEFTAIVDALKALQKEAESAKDRELKVGTVVKVLQTPNTHGFAGKYGRITQVHARLYRTTGMWSDKDGKFYETNKLAFTAEELEVVK